MTVNLEASWRETSIAGTVFEAGNSVEYITGTWRTLRPVHDMEGCTHCGICWVYCPDSAIVFKDSKFDRFDYDHCKGCGICAAECPVKVDKHAYTGQPGKVIQMVEEASMQVGK